jgi:hypothetical protein
MMVTKTEFEGQVFVYIASDLRHHRDSLKY